MYQLRFRNRNIMAYAGVRVLEQYSLPSGGSCGSSSPTWFPISTSVNPYRINKIDTIDDVAGDPPKRQLGTKGYKFHPMTRVIATETGGSSASWTIRYTPVSCTGYSSAHNIQVRRLAQGNPALVWSGLTLPTDGDRLDFDATPYPFSQVERLKSLAETAVLAKRGRLGDTNLYESLAEINKTFGMLSDLFQRARRIQNTAFFGKKGSSRLKSFTDETAGQYLAIRYGFMPTVKDIFSTIVGLEKPLGRRIQTTRVKEKWSDEQTVILTDIDDSGHVLWERTLTTKQELVVKAVSLDDVELTLLSAIGLGYKDLWSLPWELVRLSFVADWFANIGDVLSSFAPDIGFSNIGMYTVIEWTCEETMSFRYKGLSPVQNGLTTLVSVIPPSPVVRKIYRKERLTGPFVPRLSIRPDFGFDKKTRATDALALFLAQTTKAQANLSQTAQEKLLSLRRRNPSQRGRRSAEDYRNLN